MSKRFGAGMVIVAALCGAWLGAIVEGQEADPGEKTDSAPPKTLASGS